MRILCCPVEGRLWDVTRDSLKEHAPSAEIIPVPVGDLSRTWEVYSERWGEDDLMIVEQDIILHSDVIPQFEACPEPWCLFPFRYTPEADFLDTGTGCDRFRREFQQQVPVASVEAVYGSCGLCKGENPKCWGHLDGKIREAGEAAGFRIHVHWPSVGHRSVLPGEVG
jgi:hypothetical protein